MRKTALCEAVKRQPGQSARAAVVPTVFSAGFLPRLLALCALMLFGLPAMAQSTATVTLFTDTNSTDGSGNPGLGAGYIDPSGNKDLRYALQQAIYYGGTWTIKFASSCTTETPCTITLSNPLPPITGTGLTLTIDGGEFGQVIIDGANSYRVFFVDDATVTLANLQIQNALAHGGAGGYGSAYGGGGGAGLGAGVFVDQHQGYASVLIQNTYFLNCQVVGGAGGLGNNAGGGSGGGGGMAYNGGNVSWLFFNAGGGGGVFHVGGDAGLYGGGYGGNGGGAGGGDDPQVDSYVAPGGSAYGDNDSGATNGGSSNGGNGGFGGGGGGGGASLSTTSSGGNGGYGGGGGGASFGTTSNGGFGGGNGGGTNGMYGGGGGSAYGPSIFVHAGNVSIINSGSYNDASHPAATGGAGGAAPAGGTAGSSGSANGTPVYNDTGYVNFDNSSGGLSGMLPSALPASHFRVSVSPSALTTGVAGNLTVTALDSHGDVTIAYNNQANLTATDANNYAVTVLPGWIYIPNGTATINYLVLTTPGIDNTVIATDENWSYITGTSGDITVSAATAKISLSNLTQTYTGSPLSATVTTVPSGLAVSLTYNGSTTAPTAAGYYAVAATVSNPDYNGTAEGVLVISPATATVTLSNLSQTYTGSQLSASAATVPSGLAVNMTYNGSTTAPTAPGNYAVAATVNNPNYTGTAQGLLVISKAAATVTLHNLSQTYTGAALSASASASPTVQSISLTYNGSSAAPTLAGSYLVVATVSDPDYSGTATGTLVIGQASAGASLASGANPVLLENAVTLTAHVTSAAGTPTGAVNFLDGTTPLGAGILTGGLATLTTNSLTLGAHTISAVYSGDNNFATVAASGTLTENVLDISLSGGNGGAMQAVNSGGTATYTLAIAPSSGTAFPSAVTLTLSGLPSGATATVTPSSWAPNGSGTWTLPANTALSGSTQLVIQLPQSSLAAPPASGPFASRLTPFSLALLLLPMAGRMRKAGKRLRRALSVLLLLAAGMAAMAGVSGCGGGSSTQSYAMLATVSSGALSHSTTLTLTVQ